MREETREDADDSEDIPDLQHPLFLALLNPDAFLPPIGSPEEEALRRDLAASLSKGPMLSEIIIADRGER